MRCKLEINKKYIMIPALVMFHQSYCVFMHKTNCIFGIICSLQRKELIEKGFHLIQQTRIEKKVCNIFEIRTTSRCCSPLISMASRLSIEQGSAGNVTSNCTFKCKKENHHSISISNPVY